MQKRELDIVIISDVHLGSTSCRARELMQYLQSIQVKTLILNGDLIDISKLRKGSLTKEHLNVFQHILRLSSNGTKVYYLSSNHKDNLRIFNPFLADNIILRDQLVLRINQKKYWIFHGAVINTYSNVSPFVPKFAGLGNFKRFKVKAVLNQVRQYFGQGRCPLAQSLKQNVRHSGQYAIDFENLAMEYASSHGYDYVICGHTHIPKIKTLKEKSLVYMNSGDWVKNLSSLEYRFNRWSLYKYDPLNLRMSRSTETSALSQSKINGKKVSNLLNQD